MTEFPDSIPSGRNVRWRLPVALLTVMAVTALIFLPALYNGFVDFDDTDYVTLNMAVRQGITLQGFTWAFTQFHAANWHPLTWLSHMLDIELYGLNPMGHHATSVLLHVANAGLLCLLLHRMTGRVWRSMTVALLFALHPLHVESVAWVAERKDVLSCLFWLLTMLAYLRYVGKRTVSRYVPVVIVFALGLMAKQMLVTLPLVLLLMDYWPLGRLQHGGPDGHSAAGLLKQCLREKIPLLLLALAASLVTLRAQQSAGAVARTDGQSALISAGNALISYVKYLGKMFYPMDLALFYPFEPHTVTPLKVAAAILALAAITAAVVLQRRERPYLLAGWLWYLVTLLPVIGFIRVGEQALADRYTYIPLIGLFMMIVWGGAEATARRRWDVPAAAALATAALVVLSVLTVRQIRYWHDSHALFAHALATVERNWLAHNNMGILLSRQNRLDEALFHFSESVRLNPAGGAGYRNLGNALQMAGRYDDAIAAYNQAVRVNPKDAEAHLRLGYAYLINGATGPAYEEYRQLLGLDPSSARHLLESIRMR